MKIALSSTGNNLDSPLEPRFGRCAWFIILETDDLSLQAYENKNIHQSGGVGIQSASFVASKGVKAILTGRCGPKAMHAFVSAGIEVFTDNQGTVRNVVEDFIKGNLTSTTMANASQKSGLGNNSVGGGAVAWEELVVAWEELVVVWEELVVVWVEAAAEVQGDNLCCSFI